MKVSTERIPDSRLVLQIEVDDERLEKAKESAFRRLASKAKIPGFRPGKAPRPVLERHLGPHTILHEAIDDLLPKVYREALDQEEIDPIAQAAYELVTEEPLIAKFTVPLKPTVELGDYTSLRVEREAVVVAPEKVQEALEGLRRRYATLEPVERPVAWGDVVTADVRGEVNGKPFIEEVNATFQLQEDRVLSLPGVAEALIGRSKGEDVDAAVPVPEDAAGRLGGSEAAYHITIKELKQELLPELDDAFARQVGEGFVDLEALRARVEDDLRNALEEQAEHQYHDRILDALVARATIEYPTVIVEREIDRHVRDRFGWGSGGRNGGREDFERFLTQIGKTEEELRGELRPAAEERVRRSLVLSQVAEAEHILATEEEIEAELERLVSTAGSQSEEVRRLFSSEGGRESIRRSLVSKQTLDRLAQIASGDGAVADEAPEDRDKDA